LMPVARPAIIVLLLILTAAFVVHRSNFLFNWRTYCRHQRALDVLADVRTKAPLACRAQKNHPMCKELAAVWEQCCAPTSAER
jgi:hypothetical protein